MVWLSWYVGGVGYHWWGTLHNCKFLVIKIAHDWQPWIFLPNTHFLLTSGLHCTLRHCQFETYHTHILKTLRVWIIDSISGWFPLMIWCVPDRTHQTTIESYGLKKSPSPELELNYGPVRTCGLIWFDPLSEAVIYSYVYGVWSMETYFAAIA